MWHNLWNIPAILLMFLQKEKLQTHDLGEDHRIFQFVARQVFCSIKKTSTNPWKPIAFFLIEGSRFTVPWFSPMLQVQKYTLIQNTVSEKWKNLGSFVGKTSTHFLYYRFKSGWSEECLLQEHKCENSFHKSLFDE